MNVDDALRPEKAIPMVRESLIVTIALLAVSQLTQLSEPLYLTPPSVVSQRWRILRLARKREDGFHFVATGFVITGPGKTYVVTCAHVVDKSAGGAPLYADFPSPLNAHPTTVVALNREADLALLTADVETVESTQVGTGEGKQGMPVFVVGFDDEHTEKDNPQFHSGVITTVGWWEERWQRVFTSRRTAESATPAVIIAGPTCQPGESGSPVFGVDGQIVGVTTASTNDHNCLATAVFALNDLLERVTLFQ
jgi:S1-C subfamily serine protease